MSDQILGGDLKAHFAFGSPEEQTAKLEEARVEQEAMAGYALVIKNVRQTHYIDDKGQDVYEVWAVFAPAPIPPKFEIIDGVMYVNGVRATDATQV